MIGRLCNVYKSAKTNDVYLYVARDEGLLRVPGALLEKFGEPELALTIDLHPSRRLAREDPVKVIAAIDENGFYLQLPPQPYAPKTS